MIAQLLMFQWNISISIWLCQCTDKKFRYITPGYAVSESCCDTKQVSKNVMREAKTVKQQEVKDLVRVIKQAERNQTNTRRQPGEGVNLCFNYCEGPVGEVDAGEENGKGRPRDTTGIKAGQVQMIGQKQQERREQEDKKQTA